jgi:hypothetical protein
MRPVVLYVTGGTVSQRQYINIDERGIRSHWAPTKRRPDDPLKVFMFGGSTMWGSEPG